ncbi:hybrid sensor histidine kinase/response regulator [Noviherbaspirillum pedocola]|uniref:histidine kinase n=1 Tax=Noviherbaspirillum pedocola TaxID=2801341 RepID=A0A934W9N5_9BURK|nr:PAS domain-containing sensor histidine kinase [Noviherbaspirillum pedocola]MBK4737334.1 PAS domain S-box protein [Noviherbaspirillum pedocola]
MSERFPTASFGTATLEHFRHFLTSVADYAIYMLSPDGVVSSWNAGAQRFMGYAPEEIVGQHFSRFYTEEDRTNGKPARALRIALEEGKYEEENWRVRKDGTPFWASVVIDPVRDAHGNLLGFAKITRDITERRQAQEALRASEEQFRLLVQGVTDYAIYMLSPAGEVTNWNAGAARIKGYAKEEVVGTHFRRFYTEEDQANGLPEKALEKAAQDGRIEMEGWRVRKDGSRFWANVVIDAIYGESGTLVGFAKITRDITERKKAAEELERAREALFQSQKLEAIGMLTGGIAHDFNNLLAILVSGLERLSAHPGSPPNPKVLDSMQRAADRATALTQQLLAFARQQPMKHERHDLNRVIEGFEPVLRRVGDSSIAFNLQLAAELSPVMVDATQFEAALLNLTTNARHAMPAGGAMTLTTENVELLDHQIEELPAGRYVKIALHDTGSGMHPEVVARARDPFFTTKPVGQGTGLGLSQVHGFVQQSNGGMTLTSTVGAGTTISLYLPALEGPEESDAVSNVTESARGKVLVVDGDQDTLGAAVSLFEGVGYEALEANGGAEALAILKSAPNISILLTDVAPPGMTGVELAREARRLLPEVRVLLAYSDPKDAPTRSDSQGGGDFLLVRKPYRIAEIVKQLRTLG